jgi:predicted AAA+ superfamily ATPase
MIIIHVMNKTILPRLVWEHLEAHLRVMPVVVLTGPRQAGKSTLVQAKSGSERRFHTLDDFDTVEVARSDPQVLVGGEQPVTLDEVQRVPDVLSAVKLAVDGARRPGQFLLTGSANLLLMKQVSESLAGRASYLTLWPMTRREQAGLGQCGRWEELVQTEDAKWRELLEDGSTAEVDWRVLARTGGFPTPALHLADDHERRIWFDGYVRTYLERDLQAMSSISALPDFRRLMRATCHRLGQVVNQSELGRDVALPQPTVHRYLNLLETSYLLVRLPAYALNRTKRLIKSPKLYWGDTGVALHLSEQEEPGGAFLENLILHDLSAWRDARAERAELFYWRTVQGEEVDLIVEVSERLIPIEVKSTARPRLSDTAGIRAFRSEYGDRCRAGLLLHTGTTVKWLTPDVLAVPWWRVI